MSTTADDDKTRPVLVSIADARRISGLSRSELYRRLASGQIHAVKAGTRTLIQFDGLLEHLTTLPPAEYRQTATGRRSRRRHDDDR